MTGGHDEDGYAAAMALVAYYVEQSERRDEPAILVPDRSDEHSGKSGKQRQRRQALRQKDLTPGLLRRSQPASGDTMAQAESVRITDTSASGRGRAYLVERELELDGNAALWALIDDYIAQSELLNAIPMACSPLDRYLENLP